MRVVRGLTIGAVVTVLAGFGLGYAAGDDADPEKLPKARTLPSDLCARLGDVSAFFPPGAAGTKLQQTGTYDVRCRAAVEEDTQPTYTSAQLGVTVTPYAAKLGTTAAQEAKRAFDAKPWLPVKGRPYPTKIERDEWGEEHWSVKVITVYADVVVEVDYAAAPAERETVERSVLALADRAVWEAR